MHADSTSFAQTAAAALLGSAVVGASCVLWQASIRTIPSGSGHPDTTTARVVELWVYPVKGMKGIPLQEVALRRGSAGGFLWDRRFCVCDSATGCCVTQRDLPALATITTALEDMDPGSWYGTRAKWLKLMSPVGACVSVPCESGVNADDSDHSPCFRTVFVWGDQVRAEDCGEAAAAFLVKTLGRDGLRLVRFAGSRPSAEIGDRAPTTTGPGFAGPREPIYGTAFADQFQFTLASTSSLASLNNRIARRDVRQTVDMERFRPNIVVHGARPWREDRWVTFQLIAPGKARGSDIAFHIVKPVARCMVVTTDQDTGEISSAVEPLATLQTFRTGERPSRTCEGSIFLLIHAKSEPHVVGVAGAQVKGWSQELQADRVFFGTYLVAEGAGRTGHEEDPAAPTTVAVGAEVVVTSWRETSRMELLSATCKTTMSCTIALDSVQLERQRRKSHAEVHAGSTEAFVYLLHVFYTVGAQGDVGLVPESI